MHLVLDEEGHLLSAGPTLRKLIGPARHLEEAFVIERPHHAGGAMEGLRAAAGEGRRLFLRQKPAPQALLRGHAVAGAGGRLILNLGFGIGLPQAVRQFDLTDADFAPSELAMELLFLYEATRTAVAALARHNSALDDARQTAETESLTDPLTRLANRRGLDLALQRAAGALRLERRGEGGAGFAVLHLDLDGFKAVNDHHGHAAGDALLAHVARILTEETRAGDTVARPGGDEFVLLLRGLAAPQPLERLARRIIARIEEPVAIGGTRLSVSASIGIAVATSAAPPDLGMLAAEADAALYAAKRSGRGRCCLGGPLGPREGEVSAPLSFP
ncbi:diguanylate cyclase [Paracoccus sp. S-4012]|nr:GGDEF domain-containing protein [Paracoccus sp. S-4012]MRX51263.1 diguanylate cyclase [Paracoccus sp. S-4012]